MRKGLVAIGLVVFSTGAVLATSEAPLVSLAGVLVALFSVAAALRGMGIDLVAIFGEPLRRDENWPWPL